MKNAKQIKRNKLTNKHITKHGLLKKFIAGLKLKFRFRQFLSVFIMNALVFVPLLTIDSSMLKVFGQSFCNSADKIIQECALGGGQTETDLTNQAIDDVIDFYKLPPNDRTHVMRHARSEIRSMLYPRIIELIKKESPTSDEQIALNEFASRIKQKRVLAAQKAQAEYDRWKILACHNYQPPFPYTYSPGPACNHGYVAYFTGPKVPTFEEFQQFGAAIAYQDLFTPEAQDVSSVTTKKIAITVGAGAVFIGGLVGATIGAQISFAALSVIIPAAGYTFTLSSGVVIGTAPVATAASGSIGASAAAGPAAIIIAALTIAIIQGISVVNASQLPGKLQQAITDAQNQTINLRELTTTDAGNQELYGAFLLATLPDFPDTSVPAPNSFDRQFEIRQGGGTTVSSSVSYRDWDGVCHTLRMSGAWFVDGKNGVETQRLSIEFLDWNNQKRIASRNGGQFIITKPDDLHSSELVEEITFKDCSQQNYGARIKFEQMTVFSRRVVPVGCNPLVQNPDPGTNIVIGAVGASGDSPANLFVTINDAATATVNGITVRNLTITNDYRIQGNVSFPNAATPTDADFTLKVRNSIGQTESAVITIRKTAVVDTFLPNLPTNVNVGNQYSAPIESNFIVLSCANYTYSVTRGSLPPGTSLQPDQNGIMNISGTLLSGGLYKFEISKNYSNGESVKRLYSIFVKSDVADVPNGAVSWWRAEKNAEDTFGNHNGAFVGSVGFDEGKVNTAFKFDGTNGYISLPNDTFSPSLDFTFETWFKTATKGVILGQQSAGVTPYNTPQFGATPAIYVDQNGKLRVQMFGNQNNQFTTSQTNVDDNAFHHVAVTYRRTTNTRTVYLDGVNIGTSNFPQGSSAYFRYQFGTGFVSDGTVGGMNGWFNFNGLLDEPMLYDRALSQTEINKIFTAGGAGKLSVEILATPPLQHDAENASITITATGGTPPLNYSIDGGTTFQDTSSFTDLTSGNYTIVVKDGTDRRVTRQISIPNPPPTLSFTTSVTPPQCSGSSTGEIRIRPTGYTIVSAGDPPRLEYSILNGANSQTSGVFSDIFEGNYTPWVRDIQSGAVFTGEPIFLRAPQPITLSPASFANAVVGVPYSQTFDITGGVAPYTVTADGTNSANGFALPAGLSASVAGNSITISGTPTQGGTFPILFGLRDQNSCFQSRNFQLMIIANGTVSISGKASNGGQGLPNATVILSGGNGATATTNASGDYVFNNLTPNQNYTVSVDLPGYTFSQPSVTFNQLNANQPNTDFPTAFIHYEGDIAPRTAGDGKVNIIDYIALRRIRMNLDPRPANGGEWQRASVAPRSQLGSTVLLQSDELQLLNYIIAVDPLTLVGGPSVADANASSVQSGSKSTLQISNLDFFNNQKINSSKAETNFAPTGTARISATSVAASNGTATVPLILESDGSTTGVQFTVTYDASKLTLTSVTTANQDNAVVRNTSTPGIVKVAAYRVLGGMTGFPPNIELLKLNFTVNQGATGSALIDFTDAPTERIGVTPQANAVPLEGLAGLVAISGPTAAAVSVSGRVLTPGGRGLMNAFVVLTDASGNIRTARTTTFGYYHFDNVEIGQTYVISVNSKQFTFAPQAITVLDQISQLNLIALE